MYEFLNLDVFYLFPNTVAKGSRFTLGTLRVWGWRRVRSTPFLRPQPSATVHNRRQQSATVSKGRSGRAYGKFCKSDHFWRFQTSRSLVSRGRRGCDIQHVSLRRVERLVEFFVAGAALWRAPSSFWVAGAALQMCRVVLRVFLRIALSGLRQVVTRCKFRGRRGIILWDVMKIDGCIARNIDFEVANFEVHDKTPRKTSILMLQRMKIWGSLARNACFEASTCLVSILCFSFAVAVSMEEAEKLLLVEGAEAGWNVSFCVAGVALPDTRTCLQKCRKSFCMKGAILVPLQGF